MNPRVEAGETERLQERLRGAISEEVPCKQVQEKLSGLVKNVHRKLRRKYREGKILNSHLVFSTPSLNLVVVFYSSVSPLGKIRLLDVGSCFNPFLRFDEFLTVGIDIVPAVESVYKCDFLNLQLQQPLQLAGDAVDAFLRHLRSPIDALPAQLFHAVVFSLLLSYFPSPYQRWICCKKAHELLQLHGLLLIITPDSSHQNRHSLMMRSWRVAVESLGFKRCKYVKYSHMHLMAFRKVSLATTSDLVSRNYPEMLYIPQDFHSNEEEEDDAAAPQQALRSDMEDDQLAWGFMELPDTPYDSDSGESQSSSAPGFHETDDPVLLQT
uniref:S-adenosylmethionine sensor upstream of mTORC1 n=1 Tax=Cyprinodon variegatus TaxID=28743 RepID=A0A3Q2EDE5_CYPVA